MAFVKRRGKSTYDVKHSKTGKTLKTFKGPGAQGRASSHKKAIDRTKKKAAK